MTVQIFKKFGMSLFSFRRGATSILRRSKSSPIPWLCLCPCLCPLSVRVHVLVRFLFRVLVCELFCFLVHVCVPVRVNINTTL
jgi:hypothetical protein